MREVPGEATFIIQALDTDTLPGYVLLHLHARIRQPTFEHVPVLRLVSNDGGFQSNGLASDIYRTFSRFDDQWKVITFDYVRTTLYKHCLWRGYPESLSQKQGLLLA